MTTMPDFDKMTDAQMLEWFRTPGAVAAAMDPSRREVVGVSVEVDAEGVPVERVVSVKMPRDMVAKLDAAAGQDKAGRSGIIRAAVEEYLARHSTSSEAAA